MSWDDGKHAKVKKVELTFDDVIKSIQVEYDGTSVKSEPRGAVGSKSDAFTLSPDEYITEVTGYYRTVYSGDIITALTFKSNKKTYGPYGSKTSSYFSLTAPTGSQIAGFKGSSTNALNSIDAHFAPVPPAGSNPGGAGSNPGGAGSNPGGAGSNPGGAGSNPGGAGSNTEGVGSNPEGAGSNPGGAGSNPGGAGSYPGGASSNPGGAGSTPGGVSSNPGGAGSNPGGAGSNSGIGSNSGGAGSNSGSAGSNPGGAGSNAGGAGSNPGGAGSNPGGAGSNPGGAGSNPGSGSNQGGAGSNPGGVGSNPGGAGSNPGGVGSNPGGAGSKPGVAGANTGNTGSNPQKLEAQGGQGGIQWDDGADHDGVSKIYIAGGGLGIEQIKFDYVKNGQAKEGPLHGVKGGRTQITTMEINHPDEYLISVEGWSDSSNIIQGIRFQTNKTTSQNFGWDFSGDGTQFSLQVKDKKIIGFHGFADSQLNSLGAYFVPTTTSTTPLIPPKKLQAIGGDGGDSWDDGIFDGVKKILVGQGTDGVVYVAFEYNKGSQVIIGDGHGKQTLLGTEMFELDYPSEYITSVEGYYDKIFGAKAEVVTSLTFKTNKRTSPPFGLTGGEHFELKEEGYKIVGFHGKAGNMLHQIGVYVVPITTN